MGFLWLIAAAFPYMARGVNGRGQKGAKDAVPGLYMAICADWVGEGRGMLCVFVLTVMMPGV